MRKAKLVTISLPKQSNYYLNELANRWGQKKSNIISNYLIKTAKEEGITYQGVNEEHQNLLDLINSKIEILSVEYDDALNEVPLNINKVKLIENKLLGLKILTQDEIVTL